MDIKLIIILAAAVVIGLLLSTKINLRIGRHYYSTACHHGRHGECRYLHTCGYCGDYCNCRCHAKAKTATTTKETEA